MSAIDSKISIVTITEDNSSDQTADVVVDGKLQLVSLADSLTKNIYICIFAGPDRLSIRRLNDYYCYAGKGY